MRWLAPIIVLSGCNLGTITPYDGGGAVTDVAATSGRDLGLRAGQPEAGADAGLDADSGATADAGGHDASPGLDALPVDAGPPLDAGAAADAQPRDAGSIPGYVRIAAGTFVMGSGAGEPGHALHEEPPHAVEITRDFWIKATEVSRAQWLAVTGTVGATFADCGLDCPVTGVSWDAAVVYLNQVSATEGLVACYAADAGGWRFAGLDCPGYRLPTEAEWEYAARAGTTTEFHSGRLSATLASCQADANLHSVGWYCSNSDRRVHDVGAKTPNAWGLYDVHGNAWEWTNDWYGSTYYAISAADDPLGPAQGGAKVKRGGSWFNLALHCRSAMRTFTPPAQSNDQVGLRPARTVR